MDHGCRKFQVGCLNLEELHILEIWIGWFKLINQKTLIPGLSQIWLANFLVKFNVHVYCALQVGCHYPHTQALSCRGKSLATFGGRRRLLLLCHDSWSTVTPPHFKKNNCKLQRHVHKLSNGCRERQRKATQTVEEGKLHTQHRVYKQASLQFTRINFQS